MSTSTQTPATAYAKRRREEETTARADLKNLIPAQHFHADVEGDGNYNLSTKVMKAAEYYLQARGQEENLSVEEEDEGQQLESGKGKGKEAKSKVVKLVYDKRKSRAAAEALEQGAGRGVVEGRTVSEEARHSEMTRAQLPTTIPPSAAVSALPEIQQLRQCARRLVAVAEAKAEAAVAEEGAEAEASAGMSEELKASMEKGSDLMIDLIKVIEQEGWSEAMKEKWEAERAVWEGRVGLD